jgi:hypothetical protein
MSESFGWIVTTMITVSDEGFPFETNLFIARWDSDRFAPFSLGYWTDIQAGINVCFHSGHILYTCLPIHPHCAASNSASKMQGLRG